MDAEARTLWEAFGHSRDEIARGRIIEHYMPLARIIAARVYGLRASPTSSFDDYLQFARVGLIEAVDRFELARGVSFATYSGHRIRGAILNGLADATEASAQQAYWRGRTRDRIDSFTAGMRSRPERASFQELIQFTVGIALGLLLDDDSGEWADDSPAGNPYATTELQQFASRVKQLVKHLPENERIVVEGHYFEGLEFQAIGERLNLTKGRISQLHSAALQRLRLLLGEAPKVDRRL
jgi:RNA polymerase sigma factor FliA